MRTKLAVGLVMTAMTLLARTSDAQISVTATAGPDPGPTAYTTVGAAFTAINAGTHQGDITIDVQANSDEGVNAAVLNSTGAGAAVYNSVLIRPTADGVVITGNSAVGRGIIELNGADSVTIDGDNPNTGGINRNLTIQNTSLNTNAYTSVVRLALSTLVTTGNNITVKNAVILGSATGRNVAAATSTVGSEFTTYGILMGGGASTVAATTAPSAIASVSTLIASGQTATNFTASNNRIDSCARGIAMQGGAVTVAPGMTITNNLIGSATPANITTVYARAMTLQGFDTTTIAGNTVQNIEYFVGSANGGIYIGDVSATGQNAVIEKNIVTGVINSAPGTFGAYGINTAAGNGMVIRNNFVSNLHHVMTGGAAFSTTFGVFGIRLGSGTGHKVYHNSVNMFGPHPGTPNTSLLSAAFALVLTSSTGCDVRNNAFANTITGGTTSIAHVAVFLPSSATIALNLTLSNNGYYTGSTAGVHGVAHVGTVYTAVPAGPATYAGLYTAANFNPSLTTPTTNFRAYSSTLSAGGNNDSASFATNSAAPFTSTTDLHVPNGTTTLLESRGVGTAVTGVTTDIDGEPRPNGIAPDSGADEFTGTGAPANDVAAAAIVTPTPGTIVPTGTAVSPQAVFHNVGAAAQSNVGVQFTITGPGGYNYSDSQVIASLAAGQAVTVTFAAAPPFAAVGTYNMTAAVTTADSNPANDVTTGSIDAHNPVGGGAYNVPGAYPSLTNPGGIFQELNAVGATGNVVVNVAADLTAETGANALNQLAGGFTVTIKPSGAPRTISGTSTTLGLIKLNAADGVTIDGSLNGGTDRSLTIMNGNAGGTVIWIASLVGNGATGNTVKNCILSGLPGVTAIAGVLSGSSATFGGVAEAPNSNNTIQNNAIFRVQNSAFLSGAVAFDQNWLITGNTFGSTVPADKNIFRGMLLGGAQNYVISNNVIQGVVSTVNTASAMSGIQLSALQSGGSIFGNRISDIKNISPTGTGAYGINLGSTSTAANVNIFNNFVWDVAAQGSATLTANGHGIYVPTGGGYNIRYNSVLLGTNQVNATGITAGIYISSSITTVASLDVRDNIFGNTGTVGTRYAIYDQAATPAHYSTINFNDYFSSQNVGFMVSARVTLADWQAATLQDASSKAVDPLYISATNLHLQGTSTLIGAGTPIAGITTDIDGDTRNVTTPDIGADEALTADLSTAKVDNPDPVVAGANLTYTVTVTNAGPASASTVSLSDPLPAGTTFVSLAPAGGWSCSTPPVGSGGTVTCTIPSLALGNAVFTLTVAVPPSTPAGTINNTATVSAGTTDPNLGNESGNASTTVVTAADVAVTKTDTPDPVIAGANITYTITVNNAGPSNAASASLSDPLPAGTTFVSLSAAAGWTCSTPPVGSGGTVSCTNAAFAPASAGFTLVAKVGAAVPPGTVLSNTATAASTTADPNPGNESATATTTVADSSDIAVSMTASSLTPSVGTNVTFTIVVNKTGPSPATGVQVTDKLPPGLTFVSANPSVGTYTPATGVWNIGPLLAADKGTGATLSLVATVTRPEALVNQATKTGHVEPDSNASNNAALVGLNGPALADIQVQQTVNNPNPPVGTNVTFTITAKNAGPLGATGVAITDVLPAGVTFVSAVPSQGTYSTGTGLWTVGSLANNASATLQIVATVVSAGSASNVASKTAETQTDLNAVNDAASVTLNNSAPADMALGKTASQEPVSSGTQFQYTIVTTNYGPAPATGVIVLDGLPNGVSLVTATPSQGTCNGTVTVSCPLGTVPSGGSAQVVLVVNKTVGGQVSNLASVSATEADPNNANNSNTASTTPVEILGIRIE